MNNRKKQLWKVYDNSRKATKTTIEKKRVLNLQLMRKAAETWLDLSLSEKGYR